MMVSYKDAVIGIKTWSKVLILLFVDDGFISVALFKYISLVGNKIRIGVKN